MGRSHGDAKARPLCRFTAAQCIDPIAEGRVGRDGKVEPLAETVRVQSQETALPIEDGAAGRARREWSGVLDAPGNSATSGPAKRPGHRGHGPKCDASSAGRRGGRTEHRASDNERITLAPLEALGPARVDLDHGEVAVDIDAGKAATGRTPVGEGDRDLVAPNVVRVGEDAAVSDDRAGSTLV